MYSNRRKPLASTTSSLTSFSSDNSYIRTYRRSSPVALRQLVASDLHEINSTNLNQSSSPSSSSRKRGSLRIPRSGLPIPRPSIHILSEDPLRTLDRRSTNVEESPSLPNSVIRTPLSERPFYQIVPTPTPPPPPPSPIQYQFIPIRFQRSSPIHIRRRIRQNRYVREKTPGLCTTLCSGGLGTIIALIYLICALALPTAKLVLGIVYVNACPVNTNIPLYMIVSGACGLAFILFLLLSSTCTFYRSSIIARKSTHKFMICTTALARGMQGVLAIFLFVWFFIGNYWVFSARQSLRTDISSDPNYCQPALYWFAFYVLIFTYVYAVFMCFMKFCARFFCCGACDIWKRAFS
jgi:hypothetical protein